MFKKNWKNLSMAAGLSLTLFAAGCGSDENASDGSNTDGATSVGRWSRNRISICRMGFRSCFNICHRKSVRGLRL